MPSSVCSVLTLHIECMLYASGPTGWSAFKGGWHSVEGGFSLQKKKWNQWSCILSPLSLSLSLWVFYNYFKSINTCPLTFQTDLLLRLQKSSIVKLFEGKIVNYNCLLIWNYPWISKPMWLNFIPTSTLICFFGNFQRRSVSFFNCDEAIWRIEKHLHSWRVLFLASSLYFRSSSHYW